MQKHTYGDKLVLALMHHKPLNQLSLYSTVDYWHCTPDILMDPLTQVSFMVSSPSHGCSGVAYLGRYSLTTLSPSESSHYSSQSCPSANGGKKARNGSDRKEGIEGHKWIVLQKPSTSSRRVHVFLLFSLRKC